MTTIYLLVQCVLAVIRWLTGLRWDSPSDVSLLVRCYIAEIPSIVCGDFSRIGANDFAQYVDILSKHVSILEAQTLSPFLPAREKHALLAAQGRAALARVQLQRREKLIRRQPFGILIAGPPGCGKSYAAMRLSADLYRSVHGKFSEEELVVLNEGDEFQSEFRSTHKIVIFDDLGATKVMVVSHDPFRKIIDFINNVPRTALNPHLELKGNVWIQPEIVTSTTNMQIPFENKQQRNCDSMLCPMAMNRRFPLMIIQSGYNSFVIIDSGKKQQEFQSYASFKQMTYNEVKKVGIAMYKKHYDDQTAFIELFDEGLQMESFYSKSVFCSIVAFQAALRFFITNLAFKERLGEASLLVSVRRFISLPLQSMKSEARNALERKYRLHNCKLLDISDFMALLHNISNCTGSISSMILVADWENFFSIFDLVAPVVVTFSLRKFSKLVPIMAHSLIYDVLSIVVPFCSSKLIGAAKDKYESDQIEYTSFLDEVTDFFRYLRKVVSIESYIPVYLMHFMNSITGMYDYIYTFFQVRKTSALVAESRRSGVYSSSLREDGRMIKCTVSRSIMGPFTPEQIHTGSEVYKTLAEYNSNSTTLSTLFGVLGSRNYGDIDILHGINYCNQLFTFGPYTLVHNNKTNVLYVLRTMSLKLKFDFREVFLLLESFIKISSTKIVFLGRSGSRLMVAPFDLKMNLRDTKEDIDNMFKHDFMAKSFININGEKTKSINAHLCIIRVGNLNCSDDCTIELIE